MTCDTTYLCPGAPEDGGEHLWALCCAPELEPEEGWPAGARVWCPDHDGPPDEPREP